MKFIKISLLALMVASLSSCLKSKNDFGGTRTDAGDVLTSITEKQYVNVDAQNIGFGWNVFSNFSFSEIPNEAVRFFTLHISQPRTTKMSGPMTVHVAMSAHPGWYNAAGVLIQSFTLPPAGAITITDVVVPASSEKAFDFPVKFVVNKTLLNPATWYGATFTITSTSQGQFSELDKSIDVTFNGFPSWNVSKYTGRFVATTTIVDANNVYGIENNTRSFVLSEGSYSAGTYVQNRIYPNDLYQFALTANTNYRFLDANNKATGATTPIVAPVYILDATGKVIDVRGFNTNPALQVSLNPVFDASAPNSFVYTSNDDRVLSVKYTVALTLNGITRNFTITDKYVYDKVQGFY